MANQTTKDLYGGDKGHLLGLDYHEIARYSDRVIGLSMLTLIYRSITPETPSSSAFCQECIHAARNTLQEHDRCVSMITKAGGKMVYLEAYINWFVRKLRIQTPLSWSGANLGMQDYHPLSIHTLHHHVLPRHRDGRSFRS